MLNNFDLLTSDGVFYVNVSLGDIIKRVRNFYVVLMIVVSEYKNGGLWKHKYE